MNEDFKWAWGKHAGKTLSEIHSDEPEYLSYMLDKIKNNMVRTKVQEFVDSVDAYVKPVPIVSDISPETPLTRNEKITSLVSVLRPEAPMMADLVSSLKDTDIKMDLIKLIFPVGSPQRGLVKFESDNNPDMWVEVMAIDIDTFHNYSMYYRDNSKNRSDMYMPQTPRNTDEAKNAIVEWIS